MKRGEFVANRGRVNPLTRLFAPPPKTQPLPPPVPRPPIGRGHGGHVRIVPSYLLQGGAIEGDSITEDEIGITVRLDSTGGDVFYPWTSVGSLIRNPVPAEKEPF